ncbi:MAG TPA: glycerol-3-phosphate 1-O-acyltransferase PlsY [Gemmatimonadaceae bacterium]|nr:glycerol-3-phosphate 1-O-acyltransferase PlsY [Gemmatimonadaceae bacterium]
MAPTLGVLIAYLAGSIPSAYIAGRMSGVDLRKHGSGNLGATNVVRVLGPRIGGVVFLADVLKGFVPVYYLPIVAETLQPQVWALIYGAAAILGHVKPIFLLGRGGGKGVATATGVFIALAPIPMLISMAVWIIVFAISRYVSLASLCGAAVLPIAIFLLRRDTHSAVLTASIVIAAFVFWTHRANIGRLRRGEEHRFVKKEAAS